MKHKSLKYYKKRADRLFSLWVRQGGAVDGVSRCVTCGTPHPWRSIHCGHFMSRGRESTRYHEKNTGCQCVSCNTFDQGRQFEFGLYIDKRYGAGTAEKLSILSKVECKRGWLDYQIIGDELLEKLKSNGYEIR